MIRRLKHLFPLASFRAFLATETNAQRRRMSMHMSRILVLSCVAVYLTPANARGQNLFYREFKVDGVSPSIHDAAYVVSPGCETIPESRAFTASGGILHQNTIGIGACAAIYRLNDVFNHNFPTRLEWRARVVHNELQGGGIQISDGGYAFHFNLADDGVQVLSPACNGCYAVAVPMDTTDTPHTYEVVIPASSSSYELYVDGIKRYDGTAMEFTGETWFGDGTPTGGNAAIDWEYVRIMNLPSTADSGDFARLIGGNSFTGNQSVNGAVTATSFNGNGNGLTNLNPASLTGGTAAISISGRAADSIQLGGSPASSFARVDTGNIFKGNQSFGSALVGLANVNVLGNVSATGNVGAGSVSVSGSVLATSLGIGPNAVADIKGYSSRLVSLGIPDSINSLNCITTSSGNIGAVEGDSVIVTLPRALLESSPLVQSAWVSSQSVVIRFCNPTGAKAKIATPNFPVRIDLWRH